ncbi:hypothetical protein BDQ12DRAFT_694081 [Crucibulum laeve]|uniref:F-box domain-containing protein n=1 Tax=Crucibulum laeve TaxID=68775 RepID=A0A5C3LEF9_9AGAR|nr:hypothetical protein BDQ12DRAFT_694081 [Crucibulum laeve]
MSTTAANMTIDVDPQCLIADMNASKEGRTSDHTAPEEISSDNAPSSPFYFLPPELWLEIFPFLPPISVHSAALVCSLFRTLAQPLLFRTLAISPFFLAYNTAQPLRRPLRYLDRTLSRVKCFTQPHIAAAVTHVWISPYSRQGFPLRDHRDELDPKLLIDAVVDALPLFPNLIELSWHCIDITPSWWEVIHKLPIQHLWLNSCNILGENPQALNSLTHLNLDHWAWEGKRTNHVSIHEERSPGVDQSALPLLIHPFSIHTLSAPRIDTAHRLLDTLAEFSVYECALRSLTLPFMAMFSPAFVQALSRCSALQELQILAPIADRLPERFQSTLLPPIPKTCVPLLETYEGPYTQLTVFSHHALKKVVLWGTDEQNCCALCDPERLLPVLQQLATTKSRATLEVLEMSVVRVSIPLLRIFASFPRLLKASIRSQDIFAIDSHIDNTQDIWPTSPVTTLFLLLRNLILPPSLHTLHIHTHLQCANLSSHKLMDEVGKFTEKLASEHPALCEVEVKWGSYWAGVYAAKWGRVQTNEEALMDVDKAGSSLRKNIKRDSADSGYFSLPSRSSPSPPTSPRSESYADISPTPSPPTPVYPSQKAHTSYIPLLFGRLEFTEHKRRPVLFADYGRGGPINQGPWPRRETGMWARVKRLVVRWFS